MSERKIVLFGGTFDPIHIGHTAVAGFAAEQIGVEKVIFIPAKCSPLKSTLPCAAEEERFQMVALAIAGNDKFEVSNYELKKAQPSYTLETVRQFMADYGSDAVICWLMGSDSIGELSRWYKIVELIDECELYTMLRAGCERPDFERFVDIWGLRRIEKLQRNIIQTPLIDISSTEIRRRLAAGEDVGELVHPTVAEYISRRGLYR